MQREVTFEQKTKNNVVPGEKTIKGLAIHLKYFILKIQIVCVCECVLYIYIRLFRDSHCSDYSKKKKNLRTQGGWNRMLINTGGYNRCGTFALVNENNQLDFTWDQ